MGVIGTDQMSGNVDGTYCAGPSLSHASDQLANYVGSAGPICQMVDQPVIAQQPIIMPKKVDAMGQGLMPMVTALGAKAAVPSQQVTDP